MLTVCVPVSSSFLCGITITSPFYRPGPTTQKCYSPKITQLAGVRDRIHTKDRAGWVWLCLRRTALPLSTPPRLFTHRRSFLAPLEPDSSCTSQTMTL